MNNLPFRDKKGRFTINYPYKLPHKTKSPIQKILGKSNFSMLVNGTTRERLQSAILEFLEECQWDKDIILREIEKL